MATVASAAIYFSPVLQIRHNRSKWSLMVHFGLFYFVFCLLSFCICLFLFCLFVFHIKKKLQHRHQQRVKPSICIWQHFNSLAAIYFCPVLQILHHNRTKLSSVCCCLLYFCISLSFFDNTGSYLFLSYFANPPSQQIKIIIGALPVSRENVFWIRIKHVISRIENFFDMARKCKIGFFSMKLRNQIRVAVAHLSSIGIAHHSLFQVHFTWNIF